MPVTYELMMSRRTYLLDRVTRDNSHDVARAIEEYILDARRHATTTPVHVDVMTDQIDVYAGREKIAVYMIV